MDLPKEWNEFIDSLKSRRVRFVIVGAHAMAANGRPRFTQDLDILVEPTRENAKKLAAALADFGYPALARAWTRFARPDRIATLGREPLRIDILTSISGVSFRDAWKGRLTSGGIAFLGRRQFIQNKRAAGRTKDLLDIALLEEADEE